MRYAKFDVTGKLLYIAQDVPGLDITGLIEVGDDADPNNLFLDADGTAGPRVEVVLKSDRTAIVNDGSDKAVISGMPEKCTLTVNGQNVKSSGTSYSVKTTENAVMIELVGRYFGPPLLIRAATKDVLVAELRAVRDQMLAASDWAMMPDAPITDDQKVQWTNYRNALRNITTDQPDAIVDTVVWPQKPN